MAITEKYVTDAGAGLLDGTSEANAMPWTSMVTAINLATEAGSRFNVKGAVARGATDTISGGGTTTSPCIIRGYGTAIGDGYQGRTGTDGALVTTNLPVVTYSSTFRFNLTGTFVVVESLSIVAAVSNPAAAIGVDCVLRSSKVTNSSTNAAASGVTPTTRTVLFNNDIELSGASGGTAAVNSGAATGAKILFNRLKVVSTAPVIAVTTGTPAIVFNQIYGSGGVGISATGAHGATILCNTITGCAGDGIDFTTGVTTLGCIIGNMLTDNTGHGIDLNDPAVGAFLAYNRTRDNASAVNSGTDWTAATSYGHVTTDTGDATTDYQNAAGNDYSLIAASPGKGVGPFGNDIGAIRAADASGGGPLVGGRLVS